MKPRYCIAQIITEDGELTVVIYPSTYRIGTRGNYRDLSWRVYNQLGINLEQAPEIISIVTRYAQEGEDNAV